jgi:phage shock protein C
MKKLYRSRADRKIAGVCGGVGAFLDVDPTLVRLAMVFLFLATALIPGLITYIVAWILIPEEPVAASVDRAPTGS